MKSCEEWARGLAPWLVAPLRDGDDPLSVVAEIIREARDEALEEAANIVEAGEYVSVSGNIHKTARIRKLKDEP